MRQVMKELYKPLGLHKGDVVATVSPCNGWAGDENIRWKYELGVMRLKEMGLEAVAAPNSLRGSDYLSANPQARAEDIMWAFESKDVRAIIANVGGNDSIKIIPYIDPLSIINHPKIFVGYSDVMNLHILCYKCGLSSFYGDNLLEPIAEAQGWHGYSRKWFEKVLFDNAPVGRVDPSGEWTYEKADYRNSSYTRAYYPNEGYELIQGQGIVRGRLLGGHTGLAELEDTLIALTAEDFEDSILFLEDIPEFYTAQTLADFLRWLQKKGAMQGLKGILLGKAAENTGFVEQRKAVREFLAGLDLQDLPVLYGVNFGHSSPVCVLPYGAEAEINCIDKTFSILESGVR